MTHGVKKENLPSKMCVTCNRPFTWRKKWERCWDEVSTCSKGCNAKRRALAQKDGRELPDDNISDDDEDESKKNDAKKGSARVKIEHKSVPTAGLRDLSILNDSKIEVNGLELEDDQAEDEKPEKKLSRKKLQKLKMKEVPAESVSTDPDIVTHKLEDTIDDADLNKVAIEDDDKNHDVEEADDDDIEIVKPEKKLSRKKIQKLKMKEDIEALAPSKSGEDGKEVATERTKTCAVCKGEDVLLFRCQWDASKQWRFVCKSIDFIFL